VFCSGILTGWLKTGLCSFHITLFFIHSE
jgi:hypothetical protein